MESQKIDMFLLMNSKFFEAHQLPAIKDKLEKMEDTKWSYIQMTTFKDPTTALIISLLAGSLGIDRFYIGDTGMGIGKLFTCGGFGIWTIVDWFSIMGATKRKNMEKMTALLF